jgi:hypothetical protein
MAKKIGKSFLVIILALVIAAIGACLVLQDFTAPQTPPRREQ